MESGIIFDIRKFSLHDGPGIRTAVFLKGCPLSCPWCHNPEGRDPDPALLRRGDRCLGCLSCRAACPLGLDPRAAAGGAACSACPAFGACAAACPAEAIQQVGRRMTVAEVMAILRQDRPFYEESGGGVTFTGGEPLAQPFFLLALLAACRTAQIRTAVDTSGYGAPDLVLDVARRTDLLLFDLKLADADLGSTLLGVDYALCLANLEAAARARAADPAHAEVVVRVPIVPGRNDGEQEIAAAADLVARLAGPAGAPPPPVSLLPYHDLARGKRRLWNLEDAMAGARAPDESALAAIAGVFRSRGLKVSLG